VWTSLRGRLQLQVDTERDFARMREGSFVQKLWQFQGAYAWSPNLVLTSFIQYDTSTHNLGTTPAYAGP
jgi:hypothetical protein